MPSRRRIRYPAKPCRGARVPTSPLLPGRGPNCLVTARHQEHGDIAMARPISAFAAISVIVTTSCLSSLAAQPNPASGNDSALKQNFAAEHEIGRRFHFDPADLPAPKTGPIVTDRSLIVPYSEQTLQVPEGFVAVPYVTGLAS